MMGSTIIVGDNTNNGRKVIVLFIICIVAISFCYNNFFTNMEIVGNYVNINHEGNPNLADIPYGSDTLKLYSNNKFQSSYWGEGLYKIIVSLSGTKIELTYHDQFGSGGFETTVKRINWGKPKIILDASGNHYFEKLK